MLREDDEKYAAVSLNDLRTVFIHKQAQDDLLRYTVDEFEELSGAEELTAISILAHTRLLT